MTTAQLDDHGRLRHLLTLDGLPREVLLRLLDRAQQLQGAALGGNALLRWAQEMGAAAAQVVSAGNRHRR